MPVIGMGGYFFRAKDPSALKAWYRNHLDVGGGCGVDEHGQSNEWVWFHLGGPMVFEPFKEDTDYSRPIALRWSICASPTSTAFSPSSAPPGSK